MDKNQPWVAIVKQMTETHETCLKMERFLAVEMSLCRESEMSTVETDRESDVSLANDSSDSDSPPDKQAPKVQRRGRGKAAGPGKTKAGVSVICDCNFISKL